MSRRRTPAYRRRRAVVAAAAVLAVGTLTATALTLVRHSATSTAAQLPSAHGEGADAQPARHASGQASRSSRAALPSYDTVTLSPPPVTPTPTPATPSTTTTESITVGGTARSYDLIAPSRPVAQELPLIVVLHGLGATPAAEENRTQFGVFAAAGESVIAFPAGVGGAWNAGNGCCTHGSAPPKVDDVAFVKAVVGDIEQNMPEVDPSRVYLVGYSGGGKMAWDIACGDPRPFAAIATYGAVPVVACPSNGAPISAMIAGGTGDTELPYYGDASRHPAPIVSTPAETALWQKRDGCPAAASSSTTANAQVRVTLWKCTKAPEFESVVYPGHDHTWPNESSVSAQANMATLMWQFFQTLGA